MDRKALHHMSGCLCEGCIVNHWPKSPILAENQLVYRFGSDILHHSINDTQILYVTGDRYREEKHRLGYEGPVMWPGDYVDYWREEAERGSFVCWIENWHVYEYYKQWGTHFPLSQEHSHWGYWTNNKPSEEGVE